MQPREATEQIDAQLLEPPNKQLKKEEEKEFHIRNLFQIKK